jgi:hypothetical protein
MFPILCLYVSLPNPSFSYPGAMDPEAEGKPMHGEMHSSLFALLWWRVSECGPSGATEAALVGWQDQEASAVLQWNLLFSLRTISFSVLDFSDCCLQIDGFTHFSTILGLYFRSPSPLTYIRLLSVRIAPSLRI